jgi:hypothetical protein
VPIREIRGSQLPFFLPPSFRQALRPNHSPLPPPPFAIRHSPFAIHPPPFAIRHSPFLPSTTLPIPLSAFPCRPAHSQRSKFNVPTLFIQLSNAPCVTKAGSTQNALAFISTPASFSSQSIARRNGGFASRDSKSLLAKSG